MYFICTDKILLCSSLIKRKKSTSLRFYHWWSWWKGVKMKWGQIFPYIQYIMNNIIIYLSDTCLIQVKLRWTDDWTTRVWTQNSSNSVWGLSLRIIWGAWMPTSPFKFRISMTTFQYSYKLWVLFENHNKHKWREEHNL